MIPRAYVTEWRRHAPWCHRRRHDHENRNSIDGVRKMSNVFSNNPFDDSRKASLTDLHDFEQYVVSNRLFHAGHARITANKLNLRAGETEREAGELHQGRIQKRQGTLPSE